jgi:hypothetical protein
VPGFSVAAGHSGAFGFDQDEVHFPRKVDALALHPTVHNWCQHEVFKQHSLLCEGVKKDFLLAFPWVIV